MSLPRERMLEYLYGELAEDERAELEAQLAASEADRRELAELRATLRETRALVAADPAPPARVRAHVLAAADAQLRAAEARPAHAEMMRRRWLRATWLVPSLAVAAATLLMIRERSPEQLERDVTERARPSERAAPLPPSAAKGTGTSVERDAEQKARPSEGAADMPAREDVAPASQPGSGASRGAGTPVPAARARRRESVAPSRVSAAPSAPQRPERATGRAADQFAVPPPGWNAESQPRAPAPVQSQSTRSAAQLDDTQSDPLEGLGSAHSVTSLSLADLEKRAKENAAAERTALAIADYRELLRRYPQHAHANAWRSELARLSR